MRNPLFILTGCLLFAAAPVIAQDFSSPPAIEEVTVSGATEEAASPVADEMLASPDTVEEAYPVAAEEKKKDNKEKDRPLCTTVPFTVTESNVGKECVEALGVLGIKLGGTITGAIRFCEPNTISFDGVHGITFKGQKGWFTPRCGKSDHPLYRTCDDIIKHCKPIRDAIEEAIKKDKEKKK